MAGLSYWQSKLKGHCAQSDKIKEEGHYRLGLILKRILQKGKSQGLAWILGA
jgi:hypothetical protein